MVRQHRSYEEWLAAVNRVVRRYRQDLAGPSSEEKIGYDEALAQMRRLGFTTGEAMRMLRRPEQTRE